MNGQNYILEACVDSFESAVAAENAGADRIELCAGLELGGLTPSAGLIEQVCDRLSIPVYVLLRPRTGNFCYSPGEFESLLRDAGKMRELGAAGIVTGCLDAENRLDADRTAALLDKGGLPMTFHRAFDRCSKVFEAADALAKMGVERILTSGQKSNALFGSMLLSTLHQHVGDAIILMPGGGITPDNVAQIAYLSKAREFHFSALKQTGIDSESNGPSLGIRDAGNVHFIPFPEKITAIREALKPTIS